MKQSLAVFILFSCLLCSLLFSSDCQAGQPPETKLAMLAALDFLELCDQQDYAAAWEQTSQLFREQTDSEDWQQQINHLRSQYGSFQQRILQYSKPIDETQRSGQQMLLILFRSRFAQKTAAEVLTMVEEDPQHWRVAGYSIE